MLLSPAPVRTTRKASWFGLLWLAILGFAGLAHAVEFGHARLLSASGQALRADIVLTHIQAQEVAGLQVRVAPETAWRQADLTPPVTLSSLQIQVHDGLRDGVKVVRLTSPETFAGVVADFLIDVQTAAGVQRHQVSVLVQRRVLALPASAGNAPPAARAQTVVVRRGDILFAIAQRAAVPGFSVYQMMAALFAANPHAFIDGNMNLVRAGAVLRLPDTTLLARLTDRQARQLFVRHAQAYSRLRGAGAMVMTLDAAAVQNMDDVEPPVVESQPARAPATETRVVRDQLRLSVGETEPERLDAAPAHADGRAAVQDSLGRIAQLEENIQDLNQVLQALTPSGAQASSPAVEQGWDVTPREVALSGNAAPSLPGTQGVEPVMARDSNPVQANPARVAESANQAGANPVPADAAAQDRFPVTQETASPANGSGAQAANTGLGVFTGQNAGSGAGGDVMHASPPAQTPALPRGEGESPEDGGQLFALAEQSAVAPMPTQAGPQAVATAVQESGLGKPLWIMVVAGLVLLAVLLFLVMWLRRRARADDSGKITDAMIQEKLNLFDLNLHQDDPPRKL